MGPSESPFPKVGNTRAVLLSQPKFAKPELSEEGRNGRRPERNLQKMSFLPTASDPEFGNLASPPGLPVDPALAMDILLSLMLTGSLWIVFHIEQMPSVMVDAKSPLCLCVS